MRYAFLIFFIFLASLSVAQESYIRNYKIENTSDLIYDIDLDEDHIAWLATENGLQYFNGNSVQTFDMVKLPVISVECGEQEVLFSVFRIGLFRYNKKNKVISFLKCSVNSTCNIEYLGHGTYMLDDRDSRRMFLLVKDSLVNLPAPEGTVRDIVIQDNRVMVVTSHDTVEYVPENHTFRTVLYESKNLEQELSPLFPVKINKLVSYPPYYITGTYGMGLYYIPQTAADFSSGMQTRHLVIDMEEYAGDVYFSFFEPACSFGRMIDDSIHVFFNRSAELTRNTFIKTRDRLLMTGHLTFDVTRTQLLGPLSKVTVRDYFTWKDKYYYYSYSGPIGRFYDEDFRQANIIPAEAGEFEYEKPKKYISCRDTIYFTTSSQFFRLTPDGRVTRLYTSVDPLVDMVVFREKIYLLSYTGVFSFAEGMLKKLPVHTNDIYEHVKFYQQDDLLLVVTEKNILQVLDKEERVYFFPQLKGLIFEEINDMLVYRDHYYIASGHKVFVFPSDALSVPVFNMKPELSTSFEKLDYENSMVKLHVVSSDDVFHAYLYKVVLEKASGGIFIDTLTSPDAYSHVISNFEDYTLSVSVLTGDEDIEIFTRDIRASAFFFTRKNLIYLVIAFSMILLVVILALRASIRRRKHTEELLEQVNIESKLNLQLMNPHFLFNSINSIQNIVIDGDPVKSYNKLHELSLLMRRIIDNSRAGWVKISGEIDLVSRYVEFEKFRFRYDIQLEVHIDPAVKEHWKIPPMMIQPFVENSILHGLRNCEGKGIIRIQISPVNSRCLLLEIEDNGMGLDAQSPEEQKHEGASLSLTRKRLDYYTRIFRYNYRLERKDLGQEDPKKQGTRVFLEVPCKP